MIGRSHNVGLPIQILLGSDSSKGGLDLTTTLCHRYTPPLELARWGLLDLLDLLIVLSGQYEMQSWWWLRQEYLV